MPTNEPLQGFQLPTPDDPAAIPDDLARLTGDLISIATPRYATAAQRDAAFPSPTDGQHAWVAAENAVYVRSGGAWRPLWTGFVGWTTLPGTLASGWSIPSGQTPQAAFVGGMVYLRGALVNSTLVGGFTATGLRLPDGIPAPGRAWVFGSIANTPVVKAAQVATDGAVHAYSVSASSAWLWVNTSYLP
jgi:hypothetical protein